MEEKANVKLYYDTFGKMPPVIKTVEYDNPLYIDLINEAIIRGNELTEKEVSDVFSKIGFDIVN